MRKKVLFLVSSMEGGGAERVAALLSNYWVKRNIDVTLVTTFLVKRRSSYSLEKSIRVIHLADRVKCSAKKPRTSIEKLVRLRQIVKELNPDTIVSFLTNVNVAAVISTIGTGIPVAVCERIYPPHMKIGFTLSLLRLITYPLAKSIVVQTRTGAEWVKKYIYRASPFVIPNPVFYPVPDGEGGKLQKVDILSTARKVVLAVGRLDHQKGFDILIEAFGHLANDLNEWDLIILGEGNQRKELEEQIKQSNMIDRIFLLGNIRNIDDWYRRADIYILSSRFEGFPNSLLEAMAYGVPSISFDCETGPRDIIENNVNGFLVDLEDGAEGLSEKMITLMNDDELKSRISESAKQVKHTFAMSEVGKAWDEALGIEQES